MKAYQLHDSETEEILGTVLVISQPEIGGDEVHEGWTDFNKNEETEGDHTSITEFVEWFNSQYVTQIEVLELEFVQP